MELINIKGNTFYIKGGTNTGVYIYNNSVLIIDPGLGGLRPKKIIDILESKNLDLKTIINTHEHNDHYGACNQFKDHYKDLNVMSSGYAKIYIEHPELFSKYILGGKTNIFMDNKLKHKSLDTILIDKIVKEGILTIDGVELNIIDLKGHTSGSIGILTPDKVFFIGDLLVGI
ncbi:MAG: MBL fold metallo-hydrolase, partial [Romboutsia sp.]|uniref:MBL fold metallo-hydrolase n=1 Tax=Romboutsia sp. TaxID=1965302 RepID=UPI003F3EC30A